MSQEVKAVPRFSDVQRKGMATLCIVENRSKKMCVDCGKKTKTTIDLLRAEAEQNIFDLTNDRGLARISSLIVTGTLDEEAIQQNNFIFHKYTCNLDNKLLFEVRNVRQEYAELARKKVRDIRRKQHDQIIVELQMRKGSLAESLAHFIADPEQGYTTDWDRFFALEVREIIKGMLVWIRHTCGAHLLAEDSHGWEQFTDILSSIESQVSSLVASKLKF